jgi:cytochrome b6-f complex iron-sulfur subunit
MKPTGSCDRKTEPSRRRFSRRTWLFTIGSGLGLVAVFELFWVVGSFLKPRRSVDVAGGEATILAGAVDDFAVESVTLFRQDGFYLSRLTNGGFLALSSRCTHLGCRLSWRPDTQRFECPCHASAFDIRGEVQRTPALRPLDIFPISIDRGMVKVGYRQPFERDRFLESQLTMP